MATRLTKEERRAQLLDTAYRIVQEEGTDALTLARLAERAGVSKPLAYDHFTTRAGLLAALYRFYEEQQNAQLRAALADCGGSLRSTVEIVAAAYVDCTVSAGPEYEEISAALLAYEETKDYLQVSRDAYVEEYRAAFSPFVALDGARGRAVLSGLVGSAEAVGRDARDGTVPRDEAVEVLVALLLAGLAVAVPRDGSELPADTATAATTATAGPGAVTTAAARPGAATTTLAEDTGEPTR